MTAAADEKFMAIAIEEARSCLTAGDPPFGAVLVRDGEVIARGRNLEQSTCDPTAHAETMVLRNAGSSSRMVRFPGATLYASWEPCPMCLGAMMTAEVGRLVLGGRTPPDGGRFGDYSVERLLELARFSDRLSVATGVLQRQCEELVAGWRRSEA
jgi:tRNA(adenine34) deaminase